MEQTTPTQQKKLEVITKEVRLLFRSTRVRFIYLFQISFAQSFGTGAGASSQSSGVIK